MGGLQIFTYPPVTSCPRRTSNDTMETTDVLLCWHLLPSVVWTRRRWKGKGYNDSLGHIAGPHSVAFGSHSGTQTNSDHSEGFAWYLHRRQSNFVPSGGTSSLPSILVGETELNSADCSTRHCFHSSIHRA